MSFSLVAVALSTAVAGEVPFAAEGHAATPTWSLDGGWLAFEVNTLATNVDLYVAQVTGEVAKDAVKVTRPGGASAFGGGHQVAENPSWVSGNVLLFEGSNQGGDFRIYYRTGTAGNASEYISTTEMPGHLTFPSAAIGPDQTLLFISDQTGSGDVRTRNKQTAQFGQVTSTPVTEAYPMFAPDGTKVLFQRKENGAQDIYEIPVGGGTETAVAQGGGDQSRPIYVAGGGVAYFDGSRGNNEWDLVVVENGQKRTLGRNVRLPERARPAVSPDGEWVAYGYNAAEKNTRIAIARVDGSKTIEVPTNFTACGEPALTKTSGKWLLAFTALPNSGAAYRFLYVVDVTAKLNQ